MDKQVVQLPAKAMFSQAISTSSDRLSFVGEQHLDVVRTEHNSDFIKIRNSYSFWDGSLKRDIQGFKPGMTEVRS